MFSFASTKLKMKLFTAISLPEEIAIDLSKIKVENKHLQAIRWTKPEKFHITTYYLGEIDLIRVDSICETLDEVSKRHSAHELEFRKIDYSPGKNPNMIWAHYKLNNKFKALCNDISRSIECKMPARDKPMPHVTLARFKKDKRYYQPNFVQLEAHSLPIISVGLWESVNNQYKLIKKFPLQ